MKLQEIEDAHLINERKIGEIVSYGEDDVQWTTQ